MPTASAPPDDPNLLLQKILQRVDEASTKVAALDHEIRGNGEKGLRQRVARLESHMFTNPSTGDPGLVRRVNDHDQLINGVRAQMRLLNWLLGFIGTGGVIFFLRAVFGPVG